MTILRADESSTARTRWSYVILAEELRRIHAVIAKERDWRLSPAFDLTPSPVVALLELEWIQHEEGDMQRGATLDEVRDAVQAYRNPFKSAGCGQLSY